ncbi:unnamed protein product, partial [marine sediment metagenome]
VPANPSGGVWGEVALIHRRGGWLLTTFKCLRLLILDC